jgi:elongation factor P hydroxylase
VKTTKDGVAFAECRAANALAEIEFWDVCGKLRKTQVAAENGWRIDYEAKNGSARWRMENAASGIGFAMAFQRSTDAMSY